MRDIVRLPKKILSDTGWKIGPIQPRYAPVFPKSRPLPPGWEWRAFSLEAPDEQLTLLLQTASGRNKYMAWLMRSGKAGTGVLLVRIEDQPGKRGLHVHADCRNPLRSGPAGLGAGGMRYPGHGNRHRRTQNWTRDTFWRQVRDMLRVEHFDKDGQGPLEL